MIDEETVEWLVTYGIDRADDDYGMVIQARYYATFDDQDILGDSVECWNIHFYKRVDDEKYVRAFAFQPSDDVSYAKARVAAGVNGLCRDIGDAS